MLLVLIAGIASLALCGWVLTRNRFEVARDRRAALTIVRLTTANEATAEPARESMLLARVPGLLAGIHTKLWRRQSADDITMRLLQAGASQRLTAERFMAGRVTLAVLAVLAGFTFGDGVGRLLLALAFAGVSIVVPGFLLSKAAARRAEQIDCDLPHFVDQLAIAIEAGMTFDAALNYLVAASDGPLTEEMKRVLTELRVGQSRATALRSFADRVGSDEATAFANAVLASDQLGSPLAGILRAQAADLRHRRQMHAEERAQKAPVKMLFPMVLFILPVMFVVILAPAFLGDNSIF
jgi:tight adherence protein C